LRHEGLVTLSHFLCNFKLRIALQDFLGVI